MKESAEALASPFHDLRDHVIARLQPSLDAPRELVRIELSPAAAAHFSRLPLRAAAVLVPLLECETGLEVLLTQRSGNLRVHAGQISFPGGSVDPGDRDVKE
ncbi:MAG: NUDIX domain-containing protein, partial [Nevskiales bacterium]